jgi:hypothetical protein
MEVSNQRPSFSVAYESQNDIRAGKVDVRAQFSDAQKAVIEQVAKVLSPYTGMMTCDGLRKRLSIRIEEDVADEVVSKLSNLSLNGQIMPPDANGLIDIDLK